MDKLRKRKDFLELIPDDLCIKFVVGTKEVIVTVREFLESQLTQVSKQENVKNISYYVKKCK